MLSSSALWCNLWNGESGNRKIRELGNHKLNILIKDVHRDSFDRCSQLVAWLLNQFQSINCKSTYKVKSR